MSALMYIIFALLLAMNGVESSSAITEFTVGSGTLPAGFYWHKGFFSTTNDKIYLIGNTLGGGETNPMVVFDPATQTAQAYTSTAADMSNAKGTLWGPYGQAINNVYYFLDQNSPRDYIRKWDPINEVYDAQFITGFLTNHDSYCLAADADNNILYIIQENNLQKVDVTQPAIVTTLAQSAHNHEFGTCVVYNGYVYSFFGPNARDVIEKYNIATNSWESPGTSNIFKACETHCESVVIGDKIYMGGGMQTMQFYEFDPVSNTLSGTDMNMDRRGGAVVYSKYDGRLYVFGGNMINPTNIKTTYEMSNVLVSPDLCANCADNKVCDANTGACTRDCTAFQIDEFLQDCSTDYKTNVNGIAALETQVNDIDTRLGTAEINIVSITTRVGTAETNIASITTRVGTAETNIGGINTRIDGVDGTIAALDTSLNDKIDLVNARIDLYGAHANDANVIVDDEEAYKKSYSDWFSKDALIIFLLVLNMVTIIGVIVSHFRNKKSKKYVKYENVNGYSTVDENQQLQIN